MTTVHTYTSEQLKASEIRKSTTTCRLNAVSVDVSVNIFINNYIIHYFLFEASIELVNITQLPQGVLPDPRDYRRYLGISG